MSHVVLESCIKCKHMECVEVCPVDCFHEGENFLAIDPAGCIDCGVCIPACPIKAIASDLTPGMTDWLEINAKYAKKWPKITKKGIQPADADAWRDVTGKGPLLSPNPGRGS